MFRRFTIGCGMMAAAVGVALLAGQAPLTTGREGFTAEGSQALRKLVRDAVAPDGVYMLAEGLMLDRSARLTFTYHPPAPGSPAPGSAGVGASGGGGMAQSVVTAGGLRPFSVRGPLSGGEPAGLFEVSGQVTAMTGDPRSAVLIWEITAETGGGLPVQGASTSVLRAGEELELIRTLSGSVSVRLDFIGR